MVENSYHKLVMQLILNSINKLTVKCFMHLKGKFKIKLYNICYFVQVTIADKDEKPKDLDECSFGVTGMI